MSLPLPNKFHLCLPPINMRTGCHLGCTVYLDWVNCRLMVAVMLTDETWVHLVVNFWFQGFILVKCPSVLSCISRREVWGLYAGPHSKQRTCYHWTDVTHRSHGPQTGTLLSVKVWTKAHLLSLYWSFQLYSTLLHQWSIFSVAMEMAELPHTSKSSETKLVNRPSIQFE